MSYQTRKEPKDALAREMAIIACRLNSWDLPLSNEPMSQELRDSFRSRDSLFRMLHTSLKAIMDDDHVSWMWNEGRHLWANDVPTESEEAKHG